MPHWTALGRLSVGGGAAVAVALVLAVALGGCAGLHREPDDSDLRLVAASHAFGGRFDYLFVPSEGDLADAAFVTLSRTTGASDLARALATRLAPAASRPVRFLVTGPAPEKTVQVILDALAVQHGRALPYLELLYLGDPRYARTVGDAVHALGARFRFATYAR